jgi:hypothetical protein
VKQQAADEGMLVIQRSYPGPSAMLKATLMTVLLSGAATAGAQPPDTQAERAGTPESASPAASPNETGFHDLICKPNGTEDSFDCAVQSIPAKIVPIPTQVQWPRSPHDAVRG